jgi:hypothetical protein
MPQTEPLLPPTGHEDAEQLPNQEHGGLPVDPTTKLTDESDAAIAIRLAEERQVDVFCDELGNPCIRLPDDLVEPLWLLQHQRVRAWVAEVFQATTGRFIAEKDTSLVLRCLEGRAWKAPRRPPTKGPTWQQIERDPVALAIMNYANAHGEFEGLTRDLFKKLFDPSIQDRLRLVSLAQKFPINTRVFSRRVGESKHVLGEIGIDINIEHREVGSYCTLKIRQAVFKREPDGVRIIPSAKSSAASPIAQGTWRMADGTDATKDRPTENLETVLANIRVIREERT